MSKTSETRCEHCGKLRQDRIHGLPGEFGAHELEPTPPEGEADPLSPLLDMRVVEGLSEELRKAKAEGEAVTEQAFCAGCGGLLPVGHAEIYQPSTGKRYHARCEHLAAPVVSTAAPEPDCPICGKKECMKNLPDTTPAPEPHYLIQFEDAEMKPEVFIGEGAKEAAVQRFKYLSLNWNCHLFTRVAPESYKPAEGPLRKLATWLEGWKLVEDIHANVALQVAIDQLFDAEENDTVIELFSAATPVTVEAPEKPCNFCGFSLTIPHPKCVKSRRHASSYKPAIAAILSPFFAPKRKTNE